MNERKEVELKMNNKKPKDRFRTKSFEWKIQETNEK
jgi:hypothetical protein